MFELDLFGNISSANEAKKLPWTYENWERKPVKANTIELKSVDISLL